MNNKIALKLNDSKIRFVLRNRFIFSKAIFATSKPAAPISPITAGRIPLRLARTIGSSLLSYNNGQSV